MTTCPSWTTTTCAGAGRPCTRPSTRRPRSWPATPCRPSPSRSWPIRRPTRIRPSARDLVLGLARASGPRRHGGRADARSRCGGPLRRGRPRRAGDVRRLQAMKTGAHPRLRGRGRRDPRARRRSRERDALLRLRAGARRRLPDRRRHPRPRPPRRPWASAPARTGRRARPPSWISSGPRGAGPNAPAGRAPRSRPSSGSASRRRRRPSRAAGAVHGRAGIGLKSP